MMTNKFFFLKVKDKQRVIVNRNL